MKLFGKYLWKNKRGIAVFFLFSSVFAVLFLLYGIPLEAVAYASAVCAFLGIIILIRGTFVFGERYKMLELLRREAGITLEKMPNPDHALEQLYQEVISKLYQEKQQYMDESKEHYKDLLEYYTIWAHQIKTPIAAMNLILQQEDTPRGRELSQELKRVWQYVEMVLVVLRLDSDTTDYVIRSYQLDDIVKQAVRNYASQFIYKKIQLTYEPVNTQVLTDEKWLLFVIEQILSNALKYTNTGSITIGIEEPQTLYIQDTGMGIAPEDLPRIFEKGYTGYNGRSDKKASGIGLYLCRKICQKLGHTITAESVVGEGTRIRIGLSRKSIEIE